MDGLLDHILVVQVFRVGREATTWIVSTSCTHIEVDSDLTDRCLHVGVDESRTVKAFHASCCDGWSLTLFEALCWNPNIIIFDILYLLQRQLLACEVFQLDLVILWSWACTSAMAVVDSRLWCDGW